MLGLKPRQSAGELAITTHTVLKRQSYVKEWQITQETFILELSVQFSTVAQSCPTLCDLMNLSLPVHHQLLEFTQTHVH